MFYCPVCGVKLTVGYIANKVIDDAHHPGSCAGIGQGKGVYLHEIPKHQKKVAESQARHVKSVNHKQHKSVQNLRNYQTAHKNSGIQQQRETLAAQTNLKGHHSATSNSGQNSGTTQGLQQINNATRK
jgi:hypothetical protein